MGGTRERNQRCVFVVAPVQFNLSGWLPPLRDSEGRTPLGETFPSAVGYHHIGRVGWGSRFHPINLRERKNHEATGENEVVSARDPTPNRPDRGDNLAHVFRYFHSDQKPNPLVKGEGEQ